MMKKLFLFATLIWTAQIYGATNKLVDCRYISPKTTECKPYPTKFMYPKELATGKKIDFHKPHKLIISKTVPLIKKPKIMQIVRVEDMIENHINVFEPSRFTDIKSHSPIIFSKEEYNVSEEENSNDIAIEDTETEISEESNVTLIDEFYREAIEDTNVTEKEKEIETPIKKKIVVKKKIYPKYKVQKGDTLNRIAKIFSLSAKDILAINHLKKGGRILKIGKDIDIPLSKYKFNIMIKKYKRERRKSLLAKKLLKENRIAKKRYKIRNGYSQRLVSAVKGTHSLRVHATAYTSHRRQTDKTPFLAAWNNRIRPGMKIIAVSRDLIYKYGLGNGKRVRIQGLPGYYTVRDKMNKRYRRRIDIYMGINRRKALRWGRRRTVIYW